MEHVRSPEQDRKPAINELIRSRFSEAYERFGDGYNTVLISNYENDLVHDVEEIELRHYRPETDDDISAATLLFMSRPVIGNTKNVPYETIDGKSIDCEFTVYVFTTFNAPSDIFIQNDDSAFLSDSVLHMYVIGSYGEVIDADIATDTPQERLDQLNDIIANSKVQQF